MSNRFAHARMLDAKLARSISEWVQRAPRQILQQLADSSSAQNAADELGQFIACEMTMAYPEHIESIQPLLPFGENDQDRG